MFLISPLNTKTQNFAVILLKRKKKFAVFFFLSCFGEFSEDARDANLLDAY